MGSLQASLLGRLQILTDTKEPIVINSGKAEELLCYLLLFRHRPHLRDVVADTLWQEIPTETAKAYLRRTLWQLQTALKPGLYELDMPLLVVEIDWLQLNPDVALWIDLSILEHTYTKYRNAPSDDLTAEAVGELQRTVDLYRGDLLEGWYHEWCVFERERFQHMYLVLLDKLMRHCESQKQYETGIEYGARILRHDPAREHTHRQLMRLYYLAGDRSGALRQYQRCVVALHEELEVEPTQRTQQLNQHIQNDVISCILSQASLSMKDAAASMDLQRSLCELRQIRDDLNRLASRLDGEIIAVEATLATAAQ
jgi:DNA-binding SARP family transcriptional activator